MAGGAPCAACGLLHAAIVAAARTASNKRPLEPGRINLLSCKLISAWMMMSFITANVGTFIPRLRHKAISTKAKVWRKSILSAVAANCRGTDSLQEEAGNQQ